MAKALRMETAPLDIIVPLAQVFGIKLYVLKAITAQLVLESLYLVLQANSVNTKVIATLVNALCAQQVGTARRTDLHYLPHNAMQDITAQQVKLCHVQMLTIAM